MCLVLRFVMSDKPSWGEDCNSKCRGMIAVNVHVLIGHLGNSSTGQAHVSLTGTDVRSFSRIMECLVYGEGFISMQLGANIGCASSCATINQKSEGVRLPSILNECDL
jgi:hypothetical protein